VALLRPRLYLGFDAGAVTAAALAGGLGKRRVQGFARVPLEAGVLTPSPSGRNLPRPEEVRAAVRRAVTGLGGARVTLVLPDGVARVALVDLPAGAEAREYVRFRFAASLPWPVSEANVDALPAGRGRVVGAAVRRATVAEYEQAVSSAGLEVERVHLAPLLALEGLMRTGEPDAVHVVLGDVAVCLAPFQEGAPVALRNRRRDRSSGEASRLREEASRAAFVNGNGSAVVRLVVSGVGAPGLRHDLGLEPSGAGLTVRADWPDAAEAAWLGGLLA
jgi:hypothetical protein